MNTISLFGNYFSVRLVEKALQSPSPALLVNNERAAGAAGLPTTFAAKQAETKDKVHITMLQFTSSYILNYDLIVIFTYLQ